MSERDWQVVQYIKEHSYMNRNELIEGLVDDLGFKREDAEWTIL
jgi:hypothetical protein